jgi:hypothetical protein
MSTPPEPRYTHRLGSATRAAQRVAEVLEQACGPAEVARPPSRFENGYISFMLNAPERYAKPPVQPVRTPKRPRFSGRYMT